MKKVILFAAAILTLAAVSCQCCYDGSEPYVFPVPERAPGQKSVLGLRVAPISHVRVAFIGVGARGSSAVARFTNLPTTTTVAIVDPVQANLDRAQKILEKAGKPKADLYCGEDKWKEVLQRKDIDLVYICTQWDLHTPISIYAMEQGKHVAVEVPAGMSVEDCWKLVDTAERTQRHCMMTENCNYDFFEMAILNMAQQGVFGEINYTEGAYIHDLRDYHYNTTPGGYWNMWRLKECEARNGCLYPTHGIGPVAHVMNIHRGDKMNTLVSMSTKQAGMTEFAKKKFGASSDYAKALIRLGDMNNTLIKTELGKVIQIQHDVTSPRPYNRLFTISGTKGFAQKFPSETIALDPNAHSPLNKEKMDEMLKKYEHPFSKEIGEVAKKVGGHGGMDFIMDYRIIYCLNNGLPLDQDVYDAAEWSAIVELSSKSIELGNAPVAFPDFTRGDWKKLNGLKYYTK